MADISREYLLIQFLLLYFWGGFAGRFNRTNPFPFLFLFQEQNNENGCHIEFIFLWLRMVSELRGYLSVGEESTELGVRNFRLLS